MPYLLFAAALVSDFLIYSFSPWIPLNTFSIKLYKYQSKEIKNEKDINEAWELVFFLNRTQNFVI